MSPRKAGSHVIRGVLRDDSDDELGTEDLPWEWIYGEEEKEDNSNERQLVVGARMGDFSCYIGDCVLLKAEGSHEAWVGLIVSFVEENEDGDMAADFQWFSTDSEVRNKQKKRTDSLWNELYLTPSTDVNALVAINGKAKVMSEQRFRTTYPTGKVPRSDTGYGKTFVCRRGCNLRTANYTAEFVWEDLCEEFADDVTALQPFVETRTRAKRRGPKVNRAVLQDIKTDHDSEFNIHLTGNHSGPDDEDGYETGRSPTKRKPLGTPRKKQKTTDILTTTPSKRRVVVKKALEFTPLATRFLSPSIHQSSPFQLARAQLHVASVPSSLPCRESEFSHVYSHLEAAITDASGACIYISGTPGTGKTATVREVVASLEEAVQSDELDDFIFVEINGMKITDPHQSYSLLWEALHGQRVSPSQALELLEREFSHPSPRRVPCVVLMDELDQLVTKNQSVMYNFFNWPGLRHSRLIVLAVANTMDLPERTLSNKISSRLGLTRITFPGYNHEQLMRIIQSRLEGVPDQVVEPDAVQFASRKVAAVSGDARRALDICRRAVELAEAEVKEVREEEVATPSRRAREKEAVVENLKIKKSSRGRVTIATIKRAINEATSSPLQQYLRALPFASKLILASLLIRSQRTGLPDSTYGDVQEELQRALALDSGSRHVQLLTRQNTGTSRIESAGSRRRQHATSLGRPKGVAAAAVELMGAGVIILEGQRPDRSSKVRLVAGEEEVKLAFRDDPDIKALGMTF